MLKKVLKVTTPTDILQNLNFQRKSLIIKMQKNGNLSLKMLQWHRHFSAQQWISEYIIAIIYRYLKTNLYTFMKVHRIYFSGSTLVCMWNQHIVILR